MALCLLIATNDKTSLMSTRFIRPTSRCRQSAIYAFGATSLMPTPRYPTIRHGERRTSTRKVGTDDASRGTARRPAPAARRSIGDFGRDSRTQALATPLYHGLPHLAGSDERLATSPATTGIELRGMAIKTLRVEARRLGPFLRPRKFPIDVFPARRHDDPRPALFTQALVLRQLHLGRFLARTFHFNV